MSTPQGQEQEEPRPRNLAAATLRSAGRVFAIAVGAAFGVGLLVCFWAGLFDSVRLEQRPAGPWNTIQRHYTGPYDAIRFAIRTVALYAGQQVGRTPARGFAVFFDEPQEMEAAALRSIAGCIIDSLIAEPDTPFVSVRVAQFPAVVGTFRLRSFFSYMSGVFKFYPALAAYLREEKLELAGPVVEIYDLDRRVIEYVAPLDDAPFLPDTVALPLVVGE